MNGKSAAYLREGGSQVAATKAIPCERAQESNAVLELTARLARSRAEGVSLRCADLAMAEGPGMLEKRIDRPIATSNEAALCAGLRGRHVVRRVQGDGGLIARGNATL
jgi:maleate cis-trans isomerase